MLDGECGSYAADSEQAMAARAHVVLLPLRENLWHLRSMSYNACGGVASYASPVREGCTASRTGHPLSDACSLHSVQSKAAMACMVVDAAC